MLREITVPAGKEENLYIKLEFDTELSISMEKGSSLSLRLESDINKDSSLNFNLKMGEYTSLNLEEFHSGKGKLKMNNIFICKRGASVKRVVANVSPAGTLLNLDCSLLEEGASFEDHEVNFGTAQGESENKIDVHHKASRTKSLIKVKSVMKDRSKNFTYGNVLVEKDTQGVDTYLSTHALLLDEDAEAQAVPSLEIETDDVQAGHSASVSSLDEEQVFYLTTRGLSEDAAKKEIVKGFLMENVDDKRIAQLVEEQWQ